ncbi:putative T-complex protein 1, theta subunit, partial [Ostertagia ostertagi]
MAMNIPKSGYNRFMKEGAQHFKGTDEAVLRNIEACVELASQLRSAYGPNGMNKMVINHIEKLFVTNDAATILKELDIQHPAAKIIIMASQMQEKQVGDNTNTVVVLAAALLEHAAQLISMKLLLDTNRQPRKALDILPNLVIKEATDLRDISTVKKLLRSAITSKQYDNEEVIADLVSKACVLTVPKNSFNFNVDNIRICKILGSGVSTSMGTVLIENAEELMGFAKGEESEVENQVKALADSGVQVVVAAGKFGDLYLHFLNKYKIMAVRLTSKFDLRRLCRTVGAQAQARICAPAVNLLGTCDSVHVKEIGDENVVVFDNKGERGNVATIIIRGSSQSRIDDVERAVDDAVNTYKCLTKDGRLHSCACAVEIAIARQILRSLPGEKCSGLEQYAIKKFAYALETLPKCLAENAGINLRIILTKLYELMNLDNKMPALIFGSM